MNNEIRHWQWQHIIEELLSAALWFHLMLLLAERACVPMCEEEEGVKGGCLVFFLLTYIFNLATCLI